MVVVVLGIPFAIVIQRFYESRAIVELQRSAAQAIAELALPLQVDEIAGAAREPDAPKDFDELTIASVAAGGDLRVDDYMFDALDNTYAVDTTFSKVIGIAGFSFANRKMFPRTAADLVP